MNDKKMVIQGSKNGTMIRDDRYGTIYELVSPTTTACNQFGFAYVEIDPNLASPAHYHARTEELYHILSGKGVVTIDGVKTSVDIGDTVAIPIGAIHTILAGMEGLTFACVTVPFYDDDDDIEV
jgi:mannose-6-phosphate isomerase-like protein (cupin superfamily)